MKSWFVAGLILGTTLMLGAGMGILVARALAELDKFEVNFDGGEAR